MARSLNASRSAIATVAERAGVSIATVSRVVNGIANKASAATAARVWRAVEELGYRPGSVGRALRHKTSRLVAVLAANLANPAMTAMAASIETALRDAGLVMVLCDTHDRADLQDEYLLEMRAQLACAVVLLGAVPSVQLKAAQAAGRRWSSSTVPSPTAKVLSWASTTSRLGLRLDAFSWRTTCRSPLCCTPRVARLRPMGRVAGFLSVAGPATRIVSPTSEDHLEIGYGGVDAKLGEGGRQGVFCTSDLIAYGTHRRLARTGAACAPGRAGDGFR